MNGNASVIKQLRHMLVLQFICTNIKNKRMRKGVSKELHCFCLVENDAILKAAIYEFCRKTVQKGILKKNLNNSVF